MSDLPAGLQDVIDELVQRCLGARVASIAPIAPGLGLRRFYRIGLDAGPRSSVIARIGAREDPGKRPAGIPPEPPLAPIRAFLADGGWPVPDAYGRDDAHEIELLEDVGSRSLEVAAAELDAVERRELYAEACALVPQLQRLAPAPIAAFERRLDRRQFAFKADQVIEWLLPWAIGRPPSRAETDVVREGFARVAAIAERAPRRLAHRDYKAANLHIRENAPAGRRLVVIDLQGALLAPPEYDLVCLLHDSHVPLPPDEVDGQLAAVRPELPDVPAADCFAARFHLLTLTRVGKDASFYLRAERQRGDRRYLAFLPQALRTLRRSAEIAAKAEPRFAPLADLMHSFQERPCER